VNHLRSQLDPTQPHLIVPRGCLHKALIGTKVVAYLHGISQTLLVSALLGNEECIRNKVNIAKNGMYRYRFFSTNVEPPLYTRKLWLKALGKCSALFTFCRCIPQSKCHLIHTKHPRHEDNTSHISFPQSPIIIHTSIIMQLFI